jgi:hypothetical protein
MFYSDFILGRGLIPGDKNLHVSLYFNEVSVNRLGRLLPTESRRQATQSHRRKQQVNTAIQIAVLCRWLSGVLIAIPQVM